MKRGERKDGTTGLIIDLRKVGIFRLDGDSQIGELIPMIDRIWKKFVPCLLIFYALFIREE